MTTRLRNILFCTLAIIITCAAILYKIADFGNFLPEELDNGRRSYLEGTNLQPMPEITIEGFISGSLQNELESYLSGCWPARDAALAANASIQRSFIRAATIPFGFETWHTYYSSNQVYNASQNALFETPDAPSSDNAAQLENVATLINELHYKYPDIEIIVAMPDRSRITKANPLFTLSNNTADYSFFEQHFFQKLSSEISVVTEKKSADNYLDFYFKTDHHWNITGAYEMYGSISEELGIEVAPIMGSVSFPNVPFFGSIARAGLDLDQTDIITDFNFDLPELEVWRNGERFQRNGKNDYLSENANLNELQSKYNAYAYYFGGDYDRLVYVSPDHNSSNCIIIGDSYTQPIEQLIASSFYKTIVLDPREFKDSINGQIADNDISAIIFVLGSNTLLDPSVTTSLEN